MGRATRAGRRKRWHARQFQTCWTPSDHRAESPARAVGVCAELRLSQRPLIDWSALRIGPARPDTSASYDPLLWVIECQEGLKFLAYSGLSRRRSRVRAPSLAPLFKDLAAAQLAVPTSSAGVFRLLSGFCSCFSFAAPRSRAAATSRSEMMLIVQ